MVTSVSKSSPDRMRGFWYLYPMFHFKNIRDLTCLFFAVCILMSQSLANDQDFMEEFLKREYSLAKPYRGLGFSSSSQWDLMGTAVVTPDHVRLTPDLQSRQGAVWSRIPLLLRDWELKVHFKIHGLGKKNLNGDGLAIWLTRDRMQNGPVFGNMNQFIGLGIFVDTYPNADKSHDLMVDVDGKQEWKHCVDITGLRLPTGYFFGASSATGDLSDNHDIISMKLYQLTVERTPEEEKEEEDEVTIPRVDDMEQFQVDVQEVGMSGVQFFFTLLFSALGLGVLAVVGLMAYGRWTENRRKRFY
ncbi:lectin, mannose-binding 2-like b isoform X2 [Xiphias gladius]|uniref:lectin, mannose-binding 2-like b isoform X2 n=1 Tax=Xiphias gladius TaxID=8245 RepID=UPI001A98D644|nr:lectin, mannose-binding 2-like b isoform X2 [Xiphias gladius]